MIVENRQTILIVNQQVKYIYSFVIITNSNDMEMIVKSNKQWTINSYYSERHGEIVIINNDGNLAVH